MSPLTGQAKEKGKTIKDSVMSFPTALLKENVFPPRTGVDPTPKLHGPAAETRDWYSFRHTLKNVSHSSRVHFLSAAFRVPSQHRPFCSSPLALCIDRIWISNLPVPSDTCGETQRWAQRKLWSVQVWGRAQAAVHPCAWLNRVTSAAHGSRFTYLEEEAEEKGGSHRAPSPNHASGLLSPLVCTSLLAGTRHHSSPLVYACTSGKPHFHKKRSTGVIEDLFLVRPTADPRACSPGYPTVSTCCWGKFTQKPCGCRSHRSLTDCWSELEFSFTSSGRDHGGPRALIFMRPAPPFWSGQSQPRLKT